MRRLSSDESAPGHLGDRRRELEREHSGLEEVAKDIKVAQKALMALEQEANVFDNPQRHGLTMPGGPFEQEEVRLTALLLKVSRGGVVGTSSKVIALGTEIRQLATRLKAAKMALL